MIRGAGESSRGRRFVGGVRDGEFGLPAVVATVAGGRSTSLAAADSWPAGASQATWGPARGEALAGAGGSRP
jgi:hypothetical protein